MIKTISGSGILTRIARFLIKGFVKIKPEEKRAIGTILIALVFYSLLLKQYGISVQPTYGISVHACSIIII